MFQNVNSSWKRAVQNSGCVFTYFCGIHKNNFWLQFQSSFNIGKVLTFFGKYSFSKLGVKACPQSLMSIYMNRAHENLKIMIQSKNYDFMLIIILSGGIENRKALSWRRSWGNFSGSSAGFISWQKIGDNKLLSTSKTRRWQFWWR